MGEIISLEGRTLVPTQPNIKIDTKSISEAFWSCYENNIEQIPIFPVMENPKDKNELWVVDGHRRTTILDLFGMLQRFPLYLVTSNKDKIPTTLIPEELPPEKIKTITYFMNEHIKDRYYLIEEYRSRKEIPRTFEEMRGRYSKLKDITTAKKFFKKDKQNIIKILKTRVQQYLSN